MHAIVNFEDGCGIIATSACMIENVGVFTCGANDDDDDVESAACQIYKSNVIIKDCSFCGDDSVAMSIRGSDQSPAGLIMTGTSVESTQQNYAVFVNPNVNVVTFANNAIPSLNGRTHGTVYISDDIPVDERTRLHSLIYDSESNRVSPHA
jgi:hypothetical protein